MSGRYEDLEKIFHEPSRLAIMSHLCGARGGVSFTDLKESCRLTDGNLSRHLKSLEAAGAIRLEKSFVGAKPRTTVAVTKPGRESFLKYLDALEVVLKEAALRAKSQKESNKKTVAPLRAKAVLGS